MISTLMSHGVSLDQFHAGLLTPIVLAWMIALVLGRVFGEKAVLAAVVVCAALAAADPYLGLVAALWLAFAVAGWLAPVIARWFARDDRLP